MFSFDIITPQCDETCVLLVEGLMAWLGSPRLLSWVSSEYPPSTWGFEPPLCHKYHWTQLFCDSIVFPKWQYLNYSDRIISTNMLINRRGLRKTLAALSISLYLIFSLEVHLNTGLLEAVPQEVFQLKKKIQKK